MKKQIVQAEIIESHGTFTAKVYVPTSPNASDDKFYFTKSSVKEAKQSAKQHLSQYHVKFN